MELFDNLNCGGTLRRVAVENTAIGGEIQWATPGGQNTTNSHRPSVHGAPFGRTNRTIDLVSCMHVARNTPKTKYASNIKCEVNRGPMHAVHSSFYSGCVCELWNGVDRWIGNLNEGVMRFGTFLWCCGSVCSGLMQRSVATSEATQLVKTKQKKEAK